ncbi:MAG: hypothetical protein CVU57_12000 [Deltaproteobacteria bacterium HGW-Deltaproteobacteria-15]|jgi:glycosyltransferase involved in cell wall biosynthesis|nr:MAG: hypothetical protein CVU57_12000 [Deltaproteobacteria bacterium HGW-Deltaproteobacteria-15]
MWLTIFLNRELYLDQDGNYSCRYINLIDYVFSLRSMERIDLITTVEKGRGPLVLTVPPHVRIHALPIKPRKPTLGYRVRLGGSVIFSLIRCLRSRWMNRSQSVGLFGMVGANMLLACYFSFVKRKKFFFLLRGNRVATVAAGGTKGVFRKFKALRVWTYDRLLRFLIGRGSMIFTQGAGLLELYGSIPGARIIPLNAMISTTTLAGEEKIQRRLEEPVRKLLFVGRLAPEKGLFFLLDGFSGLLEKQPGLELHLVGDGPLKEELEERARSPELLGKVFFHGFVPHGENLFDYFDQCQVFVMSSYTEGLPRVIVEAMARGVPVVATRVGGIPHLIRNGENGLLYEPDDKPEFCSALLGLLDNSKTRTDIIIAGYDSAKEMTFEKRGQVMLEHLNN